MMTRDGMKCGEVRLCPVWSRLSFCRSLPVLDPFVPAPLRRSGVPFLPPLPTVSPFLEGVLLRRLRLRA